MSDKRRPARMVKKPPGKFEEPYWATSPPKGMSVCLEMYKEEGLVIKRYYIGHSAKRKVHVFGRNDKQSDFPLEHESISRVHAALIHCLAKEAGGRRIKTKEEEAEDFTICIVDLHSTHGSTLNGKKLPKGQVVQLFGDDVVRFGGSNRKYKVKGLPKRTKRKKVEEEEKETSSNKKSKKTEEGSDEEDLRGPSGKKQGWVRASHILVKHKDSRRPSSWLEKEVTRTEAEALEIISQYRDDILARKTKFKKLAKKNSHCNSAKQGGDLGKFGRGKMQKAFEEAAFALDVYELSKPVFSESGVHLILRTA